LEQANKVMHLSAISYNLKKHLKFTQKRIKSGAGMVTLSSFVKNLLDWLDALSTNPEKIRVQHQCV
jgi:hypothetical protein